MDKSNNEFVDESTGVRLRRPSTALDDIKRTTIEYEGINEGLAELYKQSVIDEYNTNNTDTNTDNTDTDNTDNRINSLTTSRVVALFLVLIIIAGCSLPFIFLLAKILFQ